MEVANPIYDSVFKYLLDDNKVARLIISAIIGEEVEQLTYTPTEMNLIFDKETGQLLSVKRKGVRKRPQPKKLNTFTVLRIDFAAKIKTENNENKLVIIEIQKAGFPEDIMRFRKYLGENYSSDNNTYEIKGRKHALPIISIYFLGFPLSSTDAPAIKVNTLYIDLATGTTINKKEEFIECLTHNSFIIQIPYLKERRRNDLECLLSIFDQDNLSNSNHILNIKESDVPEKYREVLRRLKMASADKDIRKAMQAEDEIISFMKQKEREAYIKAEKESQEAIELLKTELEITSKEIEEARQREEEERRQKEYTKHKLLESAREMKKFGMPPEIIIKSTGLSREEIEKL